MSEFAYETSVPVRVSDVDFMGIVNNAVYATYLEEAREEFFRDLVGSSLVELDTVLASLSIQYRRPIEAVREVVVAIAITKLGESSVELEYEIRADGERAATARTVQVVIDRETGASRPIPDELRSPLEAARVGGPEE